MTYALLARHADSDRVAFGGAGARTRADLLRDAATLAAALPPANTNSKVLLVFPRDRYAFAAALLGSWAAGHAVALPANQRRETISQLRDRADVVALLHDTAAGVTMRVEDVLSRGPAAAPLPGPVLPARAIVATAFTSGSTGAMTAWPKTAAQLLGEAEVLARAFGVEAGCRVVATVPPSHIYGLLFGVLLPLSTGGAFLRDTPLLPEAVAQRTRVHGADVLVSVPAHLRAFETLPPDALSPVRLLLSSTAPLAAETAAMVGERLGKVITEVFGSTETGGIAWRRQVDGPAWRPLPGVQIAVDDEGRLLVDSPFVDPDQPRPYRTADLAEATPDGGFLHRGRADGVVKVGGRRVSLPAMEAWLRRHGGVDDAAVVAVAEDSGRSHRILAAVVAPSLSVEALREALAERFERSTLPRRILHVPELPRERNGKLSRARVLRLFGLRADGSAATRHLEIGAGWTAPEGERLRHNVAVRVPEDYAGFDGHFPEVPILAGALQLHDIVLPCARAARPELAALVRLTRLKFLKPIGPGDALSLELRWAGDEPALDFALLRDGATMSGGRLHFAAPEAP